jgi:hypothetical protein
MRKNYSRLEGNKLLEMKKEIEMYDEEVIHDFSTFSAGEIHDALSFLEGLFSPAWDTTETKLQRTLIVALALDGRIKVIQNELNSENDSPTCDRYSDMDKNDTAGRAKRMVKTVCHELGADAETLKASILSMDLLKAVVADSISCSLNSLGANELLDRILNL